VSTNETRRFQPGSWRADGFLRLRLRGSVWGTSFFTVCAFGRDGRAWRMFSFSSRVMHESVLFAESGRMQVGESGTGIHCSSGDRLVTTIEVSFHEVANGTLTMPFDARRHTRRRVQSRSVSQDDSSGSAAASSASNTAPLMPL